MSSSSRSTRQSSHHPQPLQKAASKQSEQWPPPGQRRASRLRAQIGEQGHRGAQAAQSPHIGQGGTAPRAVLHAGQAPAPAPPGGPPRGAQPKQPPRGPRHSQQCPQSPQGGAAAQAAQAPQAPQVLRPWQLTQTRQRAHTTPGAAGSSQVRQLAIRRSKWRGGGGSGPSRAFNFAGAGAWQIADSG